MASAADRNGEQCVAHREQILLGNLFAVYRYRPAFVIWNGGI